MEPGRGVGRGHLCLLSPVTSYFYSIMLTMTRLNDAGTCKVTVRPRLLRGFSPASTGTLWGHGRRRKRRGGDDGTERYKSQDYRRKARKTAFECEIKCGSKRPKEQGNIPRREIVSGESGSPGAGPAPSPVPLRERSAEDRSVRRTQEFLHLSGMAILGDDDSRRARRGTGAGKPACTSPRGGPMASGARSEWLAGFPWDSPLSGTQNGKRVATSGSFLRLNFYPLFGTSAPDWNIVAGVAHRG